MKLTEEQRAIAEQVSKEMYPNLPLYITTPFAERLLTSLEDKQIAELESRRSGNAVTIPSNKLKEMQAELESLRAWKAEIEKQEPVAEVDADDDQMWADILPNVNVRVCQKLYAAPVVSPDVEKLKAELRDISNALNDPADNLTKTTAECIQSLNAELEAARKDAESWRSYKKRKDEVIAAGMGRNVLREAEIEQAKSCNELHEKGAV